MAAPTKQHNTIRSFSLICVAITSAWMIGLTWWLIDLLSGNDWCAIAIGVSEAADARPLEAIKSCFSLLDAQVEALARSLLLALGTLALCLLVLMVIVVAGGRLNFSGSVRGVSGSIGPAGEPLPERAVGAIETAGAAAERAGQILEEEAPAAAARPRETEILE